jgi:hypothetical protein
MEEISSAGMFNLNKWVYYFNRKSKQLGSNDSSAILTSPLEILISA